MSEASELCGRYLLIGPPGTGKTTFLASRVKAIADAAYGRTLPGESPVVISSLTRAAAAVIAAKVDRLPRQAVATLHAHGYRSQDMPTILTPGMIREWNDRQPGWALTPENYGYAADDDAGPDAEGVSGRKPGDMVAEGYHVLRHRMEPRDEWPQDVAVFAELFEDFKRENNAIDFTDMIELASDVPPLNPEVLICDEVQDFSLLEWSLVEKWEKHCRAMIAVGDPHQSLYTWRGARPQYLTDPSIPANHRGVLRQSYRVPQAVQEVAVRWVSQLSDYAPAEYRPRPGVAGDVEHMGCGDNLTQCGGVVAMAEDIAASGRTVMIQGACNYMLDPVVAELRSRGLPFSNPYRRHAGKWNPLARRRGARMASDRVLAFLAPVASHGDLKPREWTWNDMAMWIEPLTTEGTLVRGAKSRVEDLALQHGDATAPMLEVAELFAPGAYRDLTAMIEAHAMDPDRVPLVEVARWWSRRLSPSKAGACGYACEIAARRGVGALIDEPRIMVGTMHSFKGGECDVAIVAPDLSMAGGMAWLGYDQSARLVDETIEEKRDSIIRTMYVGMTRCRERLVLLGPSPRTHAVAWNEEAA